MIRKGQVRWLRNGCLPSDPIHQEALRSGCLRPRYKQVLRPSSVSPSKLHHIHLFRALLAAAAREMNAAHESDSLQLSSARKEMADSNTRLREFSEQQAIRDSRIKSSGPDPAQGSIKAETWRIKGPSPRDIVRFRPTRSTSRRAHVRNSHLG